MVRGICMVHCGTLWYIVVHCGTLWYIMVHSGTPNSGTRIQWYTMVHTTNFRWYTVGTIPPSRRKWYNGGTGIDEWYPSDHSGATVVPALWLSLGSLFVFWCNRSFRV